MTKPFWRGFLALAIAALTLLGLTSCQGEAGPPTDVVAQAVRLQAQTEQAALWQQLALQTDALPEPSINQVTVRDSHPVNVDQELAYEVVGTYQYQVRYPNRRRVKQSQVPFKVIVRGLPDEGDWQLLQAVTDDRGDRYWTWQSLPGDRA